MGRPKRWVVRLSGDERARLLDLVRKGKANDLHALHCLAFLQRQPLLFADALPFLQCKLRLSPDVGDIALLVVPLESVEGMVLPSFSRDRSIRFCGAVHVSHALQPRGQGR